MKAAGLPRVPTCSLLTKRAGIFTLGVNVKEEEAGAACLPRLALLATGLGPGCSPHPPEAL